jgi:hypothetical protein
VVTEQRQGMYHARSGRPSQKPNIVMLMADDIGKLHGLAVPCSIPVAFRSARRCRT